MLVLYIGSVEDRHAGFANRHDCVRPKRDMRDRQRRIGGQSLDRNSNEVPRARILSGPVVPWDAVQCKCQAERFRGERIAADIRRITQCLTQLQIVFGETRNRSRVWIVLPSNGEAGLNT